jgi:transcriptional regulator with XRE-family HTH domain
MARKRRFSEDSFGPTIERLMNEAGLTYRSLAEKTRLSAGYLNHLVHGNRPVPSDDVIKTLARALGVEAEHFREYRLRVITDRLERMPDLIDKLYRRYGSKPIRCPGHGAWRSLVSALVWGTRGPEFKSRRPDQRKPAYLERRRSRS